MKLRFSSILLLVVFSLIPQLVGAEAIRNPLSVDSVEGYAGAVITVLFSFLGILMLLVVGYGGVNLLRANGDSGLIRKSLNWIIWGTLGALVIVFSYTLTNFVFNTLDNTLEDSGAGDVTIIDAPSGCCVREILSLTPVTVAGRTFSPGGPWCTTGTNIDCMDVDVAGVRAVNASFVVDSDCRPQIDAGECNAP